jgi:hypothetical protein
VGSAGWDFDGGVRPDEQPNYSFDQQANVDKPRNLRWVYWWVDVLNHAETLLLRDLVAETVSDRDGSSKILFAP